MASAEPYASLHLAPRVNHASTPPLSFYRPDALPAVQPTATKLWRHSTEGTKAQCIYNKTQIVKTQISTLSYDYNACMKRWLQYRILSNARRVYPSRLRSAGSILAMIRKDVNEVYPEKMITACGNTCNWSSVKPASNPSHFDWYVARSPIIGSWEHIDRYLQRPITLVIRQVPVRWSGASFYKSVLAFYLEKTLQRVLKAFYMYFRLRCGLAANKLTVVCTFSFFTQK